MVNGKLPTWFVVKWLEKHPTHTAKAPDPQPMRARIYRALVEFEWFSSACGWCRFTAAKPRYDWTIYNERGKRVRFRKKPKRMLVGQLNRGEDLIAFAVPQRNSRNLIRNHSNKTVDVLIREHKS